MNAAFRVRAAHARAGGFTLIEMLVSLAVMSVALTIVGVVFAITTRAANQSAAYSEVNTWARQALQQVQEDLEHCNPAESVLVLVGRTQRAALTPDDAAAGRLHRVLIGNLGDVPANYDPAYNANLDPNFSDPRADLVAFITNRPTVSQAPPSYADEPNANPYRGGAKFAPILAVYGHAALAEPAWNGTRYVWPGFGSLRHITQTQTTNGLVFSRIPAVQWQLCRRATILVDLPGSAGFPVVIPRAQRDDISFGRPHSSNGVWLAGDAAEFDLTTFLQDGVNPSDGPPARYYALEVPYEFSAGDWLPGNIYDSIDSLLYSDSGRSFDHVATVLSEVPIDLQGNLGLHLLPGCAWFQVEFLMPEDPRNSLDYSFPFDPYNPNPPPGTYSLRSDLPRWTSVTPGETYVFVPDSTANRELIANDIQGYGAPGDRLDDFARLDQNRSRHPTNDRALEQRIIRTWPYAIRVTVRVFDPRGRLPEPIVRSLVHRFD